MALNLSITETFLELNPPNGTKPSASLNCFVTTNSETILESNPPNADIFHTEPSKS